MTQEEIHNIIRTRFKTLIADVHTLTTQYDNEELSNPDNILWCRLTIKEGSTSQTSIGSPGSNIFRVVGIIYAQLFCPIGDGDKDILAMADNIADAFRGVSISGVLFKSPSVRSLGRLGSEWQVNVECPFQSDIIG
jgi:hypothetical protein